MMDTEETAKRGLFSESKTESNVTPVMWLTLVHELTLELTLNSARCVRKHSNKIIQ